MARPSRNVDQALLDAGLELLPQTGCRGLSVRRLVDHAGVNLGMFHYHFGNKNNFIRTVLARMYEEMFSALIVKSKRGRSAIGNLRAALQVLARFARANRSVLLRIVADAMAGEQVAAEFLRANLPRHLAVLCELIGAAQRAGQIERVPVAQAMALMGGGVMVPVLLGAMLVDHRFLPSRLRASFETDVASEGALDERIEFVLRGLRPVKRRLRP